MQVLSWKPRALYFPGFAAPEHCETIIKIAKARLAPSSLALRKGETAESTKGTRTRYIILNYMSFCCYVDMHKLNTEYQNKCIPFINVTLEFFVHYVVENF